jgi:methylmalonyl-CoA/ethylmalonyl-CoA epimerase
MKFRQIGVRVTDLDRAVAFYTDLLGYEPIAVFNPPGFAFFNMDGVRLFLDVNAPQGLVYLEVEDVRTKAEELRERGIEITSEPHVVFPDEGGLFDAPGNEWLAFFRDSEGNEIGLMSREVL